MSARFTKPDAAAWKGVDGKLDGVWTTRRGTETFVYNTTTNAVTIGNVEVPSHEIAELK